MGIKMVGFDADDTLWKSQDYFDDAQREYESIMGKYIDLQSPETHNFLLKVEKQNVGLYGYGVKGMMLSMMQAAVEITEDRVSATDMRDILRIGRELLQHPVELLEGIEDAVATVAREVPIVLITKGDLFHQEAKVKRTPLSQQFKRIEIVSEKDPSTYGRLFREFEVEPSEFLMVGNSVKSDILPILEMGGWGVHVPYHTTWAIENAELPSDSERVLIAEHAARIPSAVMELRERSLNPAS